MLLRGLEPSDLPALAALCARPELAAELDAAPGGEALQSAPGARAAIGAFTGGALVGAAGLAAAERLRQRHQGVAWVAAGPGSAPALLEALVGLARDWWHLDRLEITVSASGRLAEALRGAGLVHELSLRAARAGSAGALEDAHGYAWLRPGLMARPVESIAAVPPRHDLTAISAGGGAPLEVPRPPRGPLPPSFAIRPARPDDAPHFARVLDEPSVRWGTLQVPFTPVEVWRARLAANDPASAQQFVAVVGEEVVANAGLHRVPGPRRAHVRELGVSVATAWQGRGVGRALLAHLLALADQAGVPRLELGVYTDNARAIALYAQLGFVAEGVRRLNAWRAGGYVDTLRMARLR